MVLRPSATEADCSAPHSPESFFGTVSSSTPPHFAAVIRDLVPPASASSGRQEALGNKRAIPHKGGVRLTS
jgi:hypothetical protein